MVLGWTTGIVERVFLQRFFGLLTNFAATMFCLQASLLSNTHNVYAQYITGMLFHQHNE